MNNVKLWVSIFVVSFSIYGLSLYVSSQKLLMEGRYIASIQSHSELNGRWRERLEINLRDGQVNSTIAVEGDGLEGVALFSVSGEVTKSEHGVFELVYSTSPLQTTKVLDSHHAASYTALFLEGRSHNTLIYQDANVVLLEGERSYMMLSRVRH
ncbi:hypothetical protein ACODM8_03675 [Vibrio ostreicida]|uniref:Uncharacterized protein n=1 Tax=Vibrio ostreicida TaxID=526588 RepID=A0ABT8BQR5_9VIBR|nr:hypothetical protein [Vibrio ostreicida]MDN3609482.1 hypothetical protein [Vibrio ostreicida]NPD08362.1 hypothetical protein [Vibrio ostreicida]